MIHYFQERHCMSTEKSTHGKAWKLKYCYSKADEKNEVTVEQTEKVASAKCKFCNGNHDLDNYYNPGQNISDKLQFSVK